MTFAVAFWARWSTQTDQILTNQNNESREICPGKEGGRVYISIFVAGAQVPRKTVRLKGLDTHACLADGLLFVVVGIKGEWQNYGSRSNWSLGFRQMALEAREIWGRKGELRVGRGINQPKSDVVHALAKGFSKVCVWLVGWRRDSSEHNDLTKETSVISHGCRIRLICLSLIEIETGRWI